MSPWRSCSLILGLGLLAWLAARAPRRGLRRGRAGRGRIRCPAITAGTSRSGRCSRLAVPRWSGQSVCATVWSCDAVLASPAAAPLPPLRDAARRRSSRRPARSRRGDGRAPSTRRRGSSRRSMARRIASTADRRRRSPCSSPSPAAPSPTAGSSPDFRARTRVERLVMAGAAARLADRDPDHARHRPLAAVRIAALLLAWSRRSSSCSASTWSPQTAIRADQAGSSGAFGAMPLFWGTIFIGAIIAMIVAIPLGLMSAIYLTQYAQPAVRALDEADARDPRRRADRGLRLFRRADRGAGDPRLRPVARHPRLVRKRRSPPAWSWGS